MNAHLWRRASTALALVVVAGLAACGGGGGGCSNGEDVAVSFTYPDAGSVYRTEVGQPIVSQTPRTEGVPEACMSERRFSIDGGNVPAGVTLDGHTGRVSGTPQATGYYLFFVKMAVNGLSGSVTMGLSMRVQDGDTQSVASWDNGRLPSLAGRLSALDGRLLFVGQDWDLGDRLTVYGSSDLGESWAVQPAVNAPQSMAGFATAEVGGELLVSGGERSDTMRRALWAFDGLNWTQRAATTAFPARRDHLMFPFGDALFVTGGTNGTAPLRDLWRSTDGGRSWTQLEAPFAAQQRRPVCGFAFKGRAVVVTVLDSPAPGVDPLTEVWTSLDGTSWQQHQTPAPSPLRALPAASSQCVAGPDRAYLFGAFDVVSTTDLMQWNFEGHPFSNTFPDIGGTIVDGRLFVASGVGTSTYYFYRSQPR